MAIQLNRNQIKDDAINSSKLDLTSAYTFSGDVQVPTTPAAAASAVSKSYVDGLLQGLHWKKACVLATTANFAATYNNGSSGVGATLTASSTGAVTFDGQAVVLNNRILFKDQTADLQNGIYVCTTAGAGGVAAVFTRADDVDVPSEVPSAAVLITGGSVNDNQGFVCTNDADPTIGTDSINFVQFTGAGQIIAGNGIAKSGNTISADLDGNTLDVSGAGLKVADLGIANAQISNAAAIAYSKLALGGTIVNNDIANGAAIAYAKLALTGAVTNGDLAGSIAYSKLTLTGAIVNGDLAGSIDDAKLNQITSANKVAGSAVQLNGTGGLQNSTGLKINLDGASLTLGVSGLSVAAAGISTTEIADDAVTYAKMQNVGANSLLIRNANSAGDLSELALATTEIMIGDGSGMVAASLSGDVTMANDGTVTIVNNAITTGKINALAISNAKIASNAITSSKINNSSVGFLKLSWAPYVETFTADGSTAAFELAQDIDNTSWQKAAIVSRNGQLLKKVNGSPADDSEYTVVSNAGTTTITLGANPSAGELIQCNYFAE
jgi:hypothetical protein